MSGRPSVPEQRLHEVGLQPLLEQREAGAGADVGAERDPDAVLDVAAQREQPAAEGGVAGRAVGDRRAAPGEHAELGVGRVHVVGEHGALAEQAVRVVGVDVVLGLGEQLAPPRRPRRGSR